MQVQAIEGDKIVIYDNETDFLEIHGWRTPSNWRGKGIGEYRGGRAVGPLKDAMSSIMAGGNGQKNAYEHFRAYDKFPYLPNPMDKFGKTPAYYISIYQKQQTYWYNTMQCGLYNLNLLQKLGYTEDHPDIFIASVQLKLFWDYHHKFIDKIVHPAHWKDD